MISTLIFFFLIPVNAQTLSAPSDVKIYRNAVDDLGSAKKISCKLLGELKNKKNFVLSELALIKWAEACDKNTSWDKLFNQYRSTIFEKTFILAWFESLQSQKKWTLAFKVYQNHKKILKLHKKEFEEFALATLRSSLNLKDKNQLRKELYKKSPRFLPRPGLDDYLKVAKDFRDDRQFEKALTYYKLLINNQKLSDQKRWQAYRGARITYKLERWTRMEKYIKATSQWANFLRSRYKKTQSHTKMHHDANIEYIRTLWTERGQNLALKELKRLEAELSGRYSLQLVYWLYGRMAEENRDYKQAVDYLKKASLEKKIGHEDWQRVLWSLAWNQRRIEKFKDSEDTMDQLLKDPELTAFAKAKYLYWKAENEWSQNNIKQAQSAFKDVIDFDIHGYYGALAYRKLELPLPKVKPYQESRELSLLNENDQKLLLALGEAQEFEIAEELVRLKVKTTKSWQEKDWAQYLLLLQKAGAYKASFFKYHTLSPKTQVYILKEYPSILFPQPFPEIVRSAEQQTQVSASLVYSIMKQESGFDVRARSHADAFGLLQLIPQVAIKAAERMPKVNYKKPQDLFNPEVIIPLGASNLQHLFERFNSHFILSVAAYNASEQAVRGWVDTRYSTDPVTFIEDIPYEETKGYIKLVMRNYIAYNRIYYSEGDLSFPESCLASLNEFRTAL